MNTILVILLLSGFAYTYNIVKNKTLNLEAFINKTYYKSTDNLSLAYISLDSFVLALFNLSIYNLIIGGISGLYFSI